MWGFVPLGCVLRANFYHTVVVKASFPIVIIALLSCYPLSKALRGEPSDAATRAFKRLSLLLLELTLPSIATSLIQVFNCQEFDNGSFLREQLTLECGNSEGRALWVAFASIALVVYILGGNATVRFRFGWTTANCVLFRCTSCISVPVLIFATMHHHRDAILKLGSEMQQQNEQRGMGLNINQLSKSRHARQSFVLLANDLNWLRPKFEKFRPNQWHAGVRQLVLRLLQTSIMALVRAMRSLAAWQEWGRHLDIRSIVSVTLLILARYQTNLRKPPSGAVSRFSRSRCRLRFALFAARRTMTWHCFHNGLCLRGFLSCSCASPACLSERWPPWP